MSEREQGFTLAKDVGRGAQSLEQSYHPTEPFEQGKCSTK
jgi:hypothetical protein